ncbi:membrane protein insertase YidC [Luteimonas mephitis]|uniref:membrane protein insertase YidC n=1 Tax=Luteimonas mephitis TaxID=83615 RepID=UPI0004263E0E|nr:membrane protein insertase YidC [Luteimonas mephitis]
MNQTRTFLIFAWMMVAVLLWMEWGKERNPAPAAAETAQTAPQAPPSAGALPGMAPGEVDAGIPSATPAGSGHAAVAAATPAPVADDHRVTVTTDVLTLSLDGGNVFDAKLLQYPQTRAEGSPPVKLLDDDPAHYYVAKSGWTAQGGASVPMLVPEVPQQREITLASGEPAVQVSFVSPPGAAVRIRRTYTLTRGSYAIAVHDEVVNESGKPWQGYVYRQLARIPPQAKSGVGAMTNPESYSFAGAKWFSAADGYEGRRYKDFMEDGPLDITVTGGWIALLQHHFFTAWIPQKDQAARFGLTSAGSVDGIHAMGPSFSLAPGEKAVSDARLWVGPKLVSQLRAQDVPGLERAVDYSRFQVFAVLAQGLFWVLAKLHALFGNWGWAIIALVCMLKLVLFPLSAAQYKSTAKMRRFQPRIAQLKERYGDDKQKFQMAMMELYKKEKINPVGGCLPVLPQMIIFMALYWMLMESVELRQAPWTLWIQDLTARDPYFILPALNIAIMWATQKLTPMSGMDPMQQKMMQTMPIIFGVVLAFLPAGLVLYQVANGGLGLLQQWVITKKYAEPPQKPLVEKS